ncbi:uncharacterized protein IL334_004905 [Kwoniella shivajii]|uniref:RNI-like protein n=1 Tax=Kwoniella shivajii TaxID=564305 RepID=A0ABZ1D1N6_9TREE|nr:hypothetical protein IL334_004905 [Kwoniella shivajii]
MPPKRRHESDDSPNSITKPSPRKKSKSKPSLKGKQPSIRSQRSIWNSTDDWDTLLSESALSTASISLRPPRLRELPSLVKCTIDALVRGFKRLWETGGEASDGSGSGNGVGGREFKIAWEYLPLHLKKAVRDGIFKWWGGYLTIKMIADVFIIPPELELPGELLPSISSLSYLKELIPQSNLRDSFTSLKLTYASQASDLGISSLIYHLQNLEEINIKECSLASTTSTTTSKTVKSILERTRNLKKLNLKGTKMKESDIKSILDKYGDQLECFKVDNIHFENINDTFSSGHYPKITHLCLPGNILNSPLNDFRSRAKKFGHTIGYPTPRPTSSESIIQWSTLGISFSKNGQGEREGNFPNLTHLYLPGLLIPEDTLINIRPDTLIKFSTGSQGGGPPIPIESLIHLINSQKNSIRKLSLGHIKSSNSKITSANSPNMESFIRLGELLNECTKLEEFTLVTDAGGSKDSICDSGMSKCSNLIYGPGLMGNWRKSLKKLSLFVPQQIESSTFLPPPSSTRVNQEEEERGTICPLENLDLPSANIDNTELFASALSKFPKLRSLDLSGTTITDDDMKIILSNCHSLSRIDLTSCRGVNVRHRRNIFKASSEADK